MDGSWFVLPPDLRQRLAETTRQLKVKLKPFHGVGNIHVFSLLGVQILFAIGHKSLVSILNNWNLGGIINPRILTLTENKLPWQFDIYNYPGKWTRESDALSRYPVKASIGLSAIQEEPDEEDNLKYVKQSNPYHLAGAQAINELGNVITLDRAGNVVELDLQYQDLFNALTHRFPQKRNMLVLSHIKEFWEVHHRYSIFNGIALLDNRTIMSLPVRRMVLDNTLCAPRSHQYVIQSKSVFTGLD